MLNVFADQHHFGLYNSLKMLFEDRLGGVLYRPIGKDWMDRGYWRIAEIYNNHPLTVYQYLGIHDDYVNEDGIYNIWEDGHSFYQHAITLDKFFATPIDIIIASVPEHLGSFKRLCDEHPNHPKLIYQIGNAWPIEAGLAPNIMASAKIQNVPANINFIEYHQEFDLSIFHPPVYKDPVGAMDLGWNGYDFDLLPEQNIYSFVSCLSTASIYEHDWPLFTTIENTMADWKFRTYGGSCRDGEMNGQDAVAEKIREARFIWHIKAGGDGFGHILHNSLASGRPPIVKKQYYAGKMAEPLLIDNVTCICIDDLSNAQIVEKIKYNSDSGRYTQISKAAYDIFKSNVDYDKEQKAIEAFIAKLI